MENLLKQKYGFVYIWYDIKHKMFYIGSHWGYENDGYICSSRRMKYAYKKRPYDFKRKILFRINSSKKDLLEEEYKWLSLIKNDELNKKYYNLTNHKNNHWTTEEIKYKTISEKISDKTKKAMNDPKIRNKYLKNLKKRNNKSSLLEVREKRRKSMLLTMEKKFPKEKRKKRLKKDDPQLKEIFRQKTINLWKSRTKEDKEIVSNKISIALKQKFKLKNEEIINDSTR